MTSHCKLMRKNTLAEVFMTVILRSRHQLMKIEETTPVKLPMLLVFYQRMLNWVIYESEHFWVVLYTFATNSRFSNFYLYSKFEFLQETLHKNPLRIKVSHLNFSISNHFFCQNSYHCCIFLHVYATGNFLNYASIKSIIPPFISSFENIRMRAPTSCCNII